MTALLAKDLRLSLDALRPWALLVVGCAIAGLFWLRLPQSMLPAGIANLSVGDLLAGIGVAVALSGVVVSAWCSAAVVQGDRAHGADALSRAVPVRSSLRLGAKLGAILVGVLAPPIVAWALYELGSAMTSPAAPHTAPATVFGLALAGSAIGAGLALAVAPWVRGAFTAVALALLAGVVFVVLGALVGWLGFGVVGADLIEAVKRFRWHNGHEELAATRSLVSVIAAIWALGAGSFGAWMIGLAEVARPRGTRWLVATSGCVVLWATVGALGSLWIHPTVAEAYARSRPYGQLVASQLDDAALAARLTAIAQSDEDRHRLLGGNDARWGALDEATIRLAALPPDSREREQLLGGIRSLYDFADKWLVWQTLSLANSVRDPQLTQLALEGVIRQSECLDALVFVREMQPCMRAGHASVWESPETARLLADCLRELVAQGHPESERMRNVIEILDRRAADESK